MRVDQETDERLVELAREAGHHDARPFEALVQRHQGHVVANCRIITGSTADAEDLAQEVFVKAFFGLRRFEGRSKFRTWIQRIKVNHCLNHLRRTRGTITVDLDTAASENHPAIRQPEALHDPLRRISDHDHIVHILSSMTDTLRIPLMLRDGDGMSYEEIAAQLGIGLSAVKMRIKRAREVFRARYAGEPAVEMDRPHEGV